MLERKAMNQLLDWKRNRTKQALMIMGARQVGKTTLVREFARREYESLAEVNFLARPEAATTLSEAANVDDLLLRLSILTGVALAPGETLLFLDEIQECQDMLTWVKFLAERSDLDIILSGSLLGLDAFVHVRSLPVGFLQKLYLYPLDFREYCLAVGLVPEAWDHMEERVLHREEVPDYLHAELMKKFREYLLIGGMPDAAQTYADTSQIVPVRNVQQAIFDLYEDDIAKYVANPIEARQIKLVYDAIPAQLNAPSKRFKYARLEKNLRFANMETAFDWLRSAGVAIEVTRVGETTFPLGLSEDRSAFKLFPNDVGILTSQLMGNVALDIINNRTNINYGSIFEAVVAQELFAQGISPHYYFSKKRGEVDFIIEDRTTGTTRLIEVKSGKDYRRHSALSNVLKDGGADRAVVLYDGNVKDAGDKLYAPVYAASLIPYMQ